MVFDISNAFLHLYLIHVKLSNQHFSTDYGILNHEFPVFTIVLPWIGPSFHEYPPLKPMLSFDTHAAVASGTGVSS